MTSQTDICNRALQRLGASRITAITDQSVNARACANCYDMVRLALLRSHPWNFAVQRFSIAASATAPPFGPANAYPFPTGGLRPLPPDPINNFNSRDWIVEGRSILTNDTAPLLMRFVMDISDTTLMDPLFVEALAARMAFEMCEQLTQSNEKKKDIAQAYKEVIGEAKRTNAIEKVPEEPVEDTWITARVNGMSAPGTGWGSG